MARAAASCRTGLNGTDGSPRYTCYNKTAARSGAECTASCLSPPFICPPIEYECVRAADSPPPPLPQPPSEPPALPPCPLRPVVK
mmetsp:Transcript_18371/g.39519  ORF Transcript_18371/g.39519 Transcript_18371/m.39519 type:complete len:85 (+) Transcript_18371:61-315(+)